jgi:hypothetical protein
LELLQIGQLSGGGDTIGEHDRRAVARIERPRQQQGLAADGAADHDETRLGRW